MTTIGQNLLTIVKKYPYKAALSFENQQITYHELYNRVQSVFSLLQQQGIAKGDVVATFCATSPQLVTFLLANMCYGSVVVPINMHFKENEISHIVDDAKVKLVFVDEDRRHLVDNKLKCISELSQNKSDGFPCVGEDDGAVIFYTSGTTGKPKGALLSHKNIISNIQILHEVWQWGESDVLLHTLPLYHIHGIGVALLGALLAGNTLVFKEKFFANQALHLMSKQHITLFMGTPTHYELLMRVPNAVQYDVRNMRLFVSGSAPLSNEQFTRFKRLFGHEILERAGMSETMMNFSNPYCGLRKPGTVGLPLPGVQVRIVDEFFNDAQEGQILLRGENVFSGYINKDNSKYFHDGFFLTGDIGKKDQDGYVTLLGRMHDVIISGGINIYPKEIEDVIISLPEIKECAVVGVPDVLYGQVPHAFVVCEKPIAATSIIAFCKSQLASFKKPKYVSFVDALPRNAMGKVQKNQLLPASYVG